MKTKLLSILAFLLILLPIVNATSFGYNYLDNQEYVIEGANYSINVNNTEFHRGLTPQQVADLRVIDLNSTQFETGEPATIKTSWLTSFINAIVSVFNPFDQVLNTTSNVNFRNVNASNITTSKIYPSADSTTAVGIFKADGTTNVVNVDTTNRRVGVGTGATTPAALLTVNGDVLIGATTKPSAAAFMAQIKGTTHGLALAINLPTASTNGLAFSVLATGEGYARTNFYSNSFIGFGPGNATRDVFIGRTAANTIGIVGNYDGTGTGNFYVSGNVSIGGTTAPTEKLEVNGNIRLTNDNNKIQLGTAQDFYIAYDGTNAIFNTSAVGSGIAYFSDNVSATGFITRTSVYDSSKGTALDNIKDVKELTYKNSKDKEQINHSAFYGYTKFNTTDYSKPVKENIVEEVCNEIMDSETNETINECENITREVTTYPHKKVEEGVDLGMEIDVLRQAVYELKLQNEFLQEQINNLTGKDIDLSKANDRQDEAICTIKLFEWCIK